MIGQRNWANCDFTSEVYMQKEHVCSDEITTVLRVRIGMFSVKSIHWEVMKEDSEQYFTWHFDPKVKKFWFCLQNWAIQSEFFELHKDVFILLFHFFRRQILERKTRDANGQDSTGRSSTLPYQEKIVKWVCEFEMLFPIHHGRKKNILF